MQDTDFEIDNMPESMIFVHIQIFFFLQKKIRLTFYLYFLGCFLCFII